MRILSIHPTATATLTLLVAIGCAKAPATEPPPSTANGAAATDASTLPEDPFPPPTGPHGVGMREYHWIDGDRLELLTTNPTDHRRVPVRFWYPAEIPADAEHARYILDPSEFEGADAVHQAAGVRTHAVFEATLANPVPPLPRCPVLLYQHGGGWPWFVGTALGEELASRGFVVVSVGHDGFSQSQRRPDGTSALPDAAPFPDETGDLRADALASWEHLEKHHFPVWVADARFALDHLQQLETDPAWPFAGHLDLDHIGMYGWSFGGAASIQALVDDPRVKAGIDMDGQLFGDAHTRGTARPFLILRSGIAPTLEGEQDTPANTAVLTEMMAMVDQKEASLLAHSTGTRSAIEIAGTSHGAFSDLLFFAPASAGTIAPARGHEILAALVGDFFGLHLQGIPAPWLDDPSSRFPELRRR